MALTEFVFHSVGLIPPGCLIAVYDGRPTQSLMMRRSAAAQKSECCVVVLASMAQTCASKGGLANGRHVGALAVLSHVVRMSAVKVVEVRLDPQVKGWFGGGNQVVAPFSQGRLVQLRVLDGDSVDPSPITTACAHPSTHPAICRSWADLGLGRVAVFKVRSDTEQRDLPRNQHCE